MKNKQAFVPDYAWDAFVSYAHVDNQQVLLGEENSRWVNNLVRTITTGLSQKLGRLDRGRVWQDQRIDPTSSFSSEIEEAVANSAVLIVIMTDGYLESEWCAKEREAFVRAMHRRGGIQNRIFIVQPTETDRTRWPDEYHELLGYQFYKRLSEDVPPETLGRPVIDGSDRVYFQRVDKLVRDLSSKLHKCRESEDKPAPPPERTSVFLSEVTADLESDRDGIRSFLQQADIDVLPKTYYERSPDAYEAAMRADLERCVAFVQLVGPYTTPYTADLPKGYEGLQLDVAEDVQLPVFRWRSPDLDIGSMRDPSILDRGEVMVMALEEFKHLVEQRARLFAATQKLTVNGDAFVLINANSKDQTVADDICMELERNDIGYEVVDESAPFADLARDSETDYHALMVIYGECEREWARDRVRDCRKVSFSRKTSPPICGVYVAAPPASEPLRIKPPRFFFFHDPHETQFDEFVKAIQSRASE